jgi:hypothetical protein
MLGRAKSKHGIGWAIIDYMMLFQDTAKDETQFTAHVSRALKNISTDLDLAVICVHSVTKMGMDGDSDPTKSQARGSGQVLHDADLIMHITKFKPGGSAEQSAALKYGDKLATMWITKGRELEDAKNRNHLCRRGDSPFWGELDLERK